MVATESTMNPLGTKLPAFSLPDIDGKTVSSADFEGRPLLVMFICNHCPFVKYVAGELAEIGREYQAKGFSVVAINPNDVEKHPDDSPAKMAEEVKARGYTFAYLYDETQAVAKAFGAACTPDFFVYDKDGKLAYRGQLDDSRPSNDVPLSGSDLRAAMESVLAGKAIKGDQKPSIGCNIKWKPGNEPDYAT